MQKGCKTCSGWAFGRAQIPASDALTKKVIPACIPGVSLRQSLICDCFLFAFYYWIHCCNTILYFCLI